MSSAKEAHLWLLATLQWGLDSTSAQPMPETVAHSLTLRTALHRVRKRLVKVVGIERVNT